MWHLLPHIFNLLCLVRIVCFPRRKEENNVKNDPFCTNDTLTLTLTLKTESRIAKAISSLTESSI